MQIYYWKIIIILICYLNYPISRTMGLDEMHLQVPRELVDDVAKPLSIIFEKLQQFGEVPSD